MAKAQSLAAQAGAVEFTLPAVFGSGAAPPAVVGRKWPPLVTFAHPKRSDEWNKIVGKYGKAVEGGMYFVHNDRVERLETAKLGWFVGRQYWVHKKENGEVIATSFKEMPAPYKEAIEACVIVYLPDGLAFPANVQFRTTKCSAGKALSDEFLACQEAAWSERGGAYKEAVAVRDPCARFFGEVTEGPVRTSKTSGNPYTTLETIIKPTGMAEWRAYSEMLKDPERADLVQKVAANYERRMAEVAQKLAK